MLRSQWWSNHGFSTQNQHGLSFLLNLSLMIGLALILYPLFVFSHQSFSDENAHVCVFSRGEVLVVLQLLHGVANSICQQLNSRNIAQIAEYEFRPKHKPQFHFSCMSYRILILHGKKGWSESPKQTSAKISSLHKCLKSSKKVSFLLKSE